MIKKRLLGTGLAVLALAAMVSGCGREASAQRTEDQRTNSSEQIQTGSIDIEREADTEEAAEREDTPSELTVYFGDDGAPFTLYLEDNATAQAIAEYVGTSNWRLPIYHYDDYENYEVMQYYDIPSRYEIPSEPQTVTGEAAGELYYSEPNRIVLFYQDAQVSGEYTLVGHFEANEDFVTAVEENPVLEGWGNKIVRIER